MQQTPQRPSWATVVGILGIILGVLGILGGGYDLMMPSMMKMQQEMMGSMQETFEKLEKEQTEEKAKQGQLGQDGEQIVIQPKDIFEPMQKMFEMPEWYAKFSLASGLARMSLGAVYLLACIFMLMLKPISIRLFYLAAGGFILLTAIKTGILMSSISFVSMAFSFWGIVGAIIDIVLVIVVATSDKSAFYHKELTFQTMG